MDEFLSWGGKLLRLVLGSTFKGSGIPKSHDFNVCGFWDLICLERVLGIIGVLKGSQGARLRVIGC